MIAVPEVMAIAALTLTAMVSATAVRPKGAATVGATASQAITGDAARSTACRYLSFLS
jgi:hypothetical protein